ncbi:hypothetical protein HMPREF3162_01620 [Brevibacterium sp. HMSC07C04]|nr:hypothetical protein HMPREF3162_01620 [Brevibacterium sp. HMSC07C04]
MFDLGEPRFLGVFYADLDSPSVNVRNSPEVDLTAVADKERKALWAVIMCMVGRCAEVNWDSSLYPDRYVFVWEELCAPCARGYDDAASSNGVG